MALRREIEDELRPHERPGLKDKHPPGHHLTSLTRLRISVIVLGETALELERDTTPHHTHAVHRVDQCLRGVVKQIALSDLNHRNTISCVLAPLAKTSFLV